MSFPTPSEQFENRDDETGQQAGSHGAPVDAANADWIHPRPRLRDVAGSAANSNLVLVVDGSGKARSIVDAPVDAGVTFPEIREGQSVGECWPEKIASLIEKNCRGVLRGRQVRSTCAGSRYLGRDYEFIFIAQGRDAVMLIVRDVTDQQRHLSKLEKLAFEDPVTGLPNREWLINETALALERQNLHGGRCALILVDIDQLELAAVTLSEEQCDDVLRELSRRMHGDLRGANRHNEYDDERYSAVARLNARRFGILLPSIDTGEDAEAVATRIADDLEAPVDVGGRSAKVKVAAGIALHPQDGLSAKDLYESALTAMHDARHSQTLRRRFHSGTVRMRVLERQDIETALRKALENRELTLAYQAIIERESGAPVAAEALLRWPRPLFGARPIREVVAVADYTGLILPIGEWVLRSACEQIVRWHEAGHAELKVCINVSGQEFSRADLAERTRRVLAETGAAPEAVVFEITERLLFRDAVHDYPVCGALKEIGVGLSVDDYGVGVCSFDHLSRSPVDNVKIHPDIVAGAADGGPSRAACAAVTAMAHALDVRVVAEGVETEAQAQVLRDIGCDYLQGFLFSRPAAAAEALSVVVQDPAPTSQPREPVNGQA